METPLTVTLLNCAQDRKTFANPKVPFYFGHRMGEFKHFTNSDILFFLESRDSENFRALHKFYEESGFKTLLFKNNDTDLSMGIMLAYKPESVTVHNAESIYFAGSKDAKYPDGAWGSLGVLVDFGSFRILAAQFPLGLDNKHIAYNKCRQVVEAHDKPTMLIGDLNTFNDTPEEHALMQKIKQHGTSLVNQGTWLGWSEDYPVPNGEVGSQLDHAITFNGLKGSARVETGKQLRESEFNFRFSDHAALVVTLTL